MHLWISHFCKEGRVTTVPLLLLSIISISTDALLNAALSEAFVHVHFPNRNAVLFISIYKPISADDLVGRLMPRAHDRMGSRPFIE